MGVLALAGLPAVTVKHDDDFPDAPGSDARYLGPVPLACKRIKTQLDVLDAMQVQGFVDAVVVLPSDTIHDVNSSLNQ